MSKTHGGSAKKKKPNPKLTNVDKVAAIAIDLGIYAPDPEEANLDYANNFEQALGILNINLPITGLEGNSNSEDGDPVLQIRKQEDLLKKGIVEQIPVLREQKNQKDMLHKWHASLTGNNVRIKNSLEALLESAKKDDFVKLLENVSDTLINYSQPTNN